MALRLAYLGWDYCGLAIQDGVDTVEVSITIYPLPLPAFYIDLLQCLFPIPHVPASRPVSSEACRPPSWLSVLVSVAFHAVAAQTQESVLWDR